MEFLEGRNNPFEVFLEWYAQAQNCGLAEPTAMTLATADNNGQPSVRTILLKTVDESGFAFFTNFNSRKGKELKENPKAALLFYWMPLKKQVRVEGRVEEVNEEEADKYFNSRHPQSRVGAWASHQSDLLSTRDELLKRFAEYQEKFTDEIPRPPHWSGFRLVPSYFEFWEEGEFRLHNRRIYMRENGRSWQTGLLNP